MWMHLRHCRKKLTVRKLCRLRLRWRRRFLKGIENFRLVCLEGVLARLALQALLCVHFAHDELVDRAIEIPDVDGRPAHRYPADWTYAFALQPFEEAITAKGVRAFQRMRLDEDILANGTLQLRLQVEVRNNLHALNGGIFTVIPALALHLLLLLFILLLRGWTQPVNRRVDDVLLVVDAGAARALLRRWWRTSGRCRVGRRPLHRGPFSGGRRCGCCRGGHDHAGLLGTMALTMEGVDKRVLHLRGREGSYHRREAYPRRAEGYDIVVTKDLAPHAAAHEAPIDVCSVCAAQVLQHVIVVRRLVVVIVSSSPLLLVRTVLSSRRDSVRTMASPRERCMLPRNDGRYSFEHNVAVRIASDDNRDLSIGLCIRGRRRRRTSILRSCIFSSGGFSLARAPRRCLGRLSRLLRTRRCTSRPCTTTTTTTSSSILPTRSSSLAMRGEQRIEIHALRRLN